MRGLIYLPAVTGVAVGQYAGVGVVMGPRSEQYVMIMELLCDSPRPRYEHTHPKTHTQR